jgi:hypothetical protein
MVRLLLQYGDLGYYVFVKDGGKSGRLKDVVVLAPDRTFKRLGGLLRSMFVIGLDLFF